MPSAVGNSEVFGASGSLASRPHSSASTSSSQQQESLPSSQTSSCTSYTLAGPAAPGTCGSAAPPPSPVSPPTRGGGENDILAGLPDPKLQFLSFKRKDRRRKCFLKPLALKDAKWAGPDSPPLRLSPYSEPCEKHRVVHCYPADFPFPEPTCPDLVSATAVTSTDPDNELAVSDEPAAQNDQVTNPPASPVCVMEVESESD